FSLSRLIYLFTNFYYLSDQTSMNASNSEGEETPMAQHGEFDQDDVPKVTTINNWIVTFSQKWKKNMTKLSLEVVETSET
ncbi:1045_t:CDS:2, partial [Cetraspora pellucida]